MKIKAVKTCLSATFYFYLVDLHEGGRKFGLQLRIVDAKLCIVATLQRMQERQLIIAGVQESLEMGPAVELLEPRADVRWLRGQGNGLGLGRLLLLIA